MTSTNAEPGANAEMRNVPPIGNLPPIGHLPPVDGRPSVGGRPDPALGSHMRDRERGFRRATALTVGLATASIAASLVVAGVARAATQASRATTPDDAVTGSGDAGGGNSPDTSQGSGGSQGSLWPGLFGGGGPPHVTSGGS
jgi:hypothetical protein